MTMPPTPRRRPRWAPLAALLAALVSAPAASAQAGPGDAAAFNGTWTMNAGDIETGKAQWFSAFRIWAVDEHRMRVEFNAEYLFQQSDGPNIHTSEAGGIAVLDGEKASFRTTDYDCLYTLRLRGDTLQVTESGECFGMGVRVTGTYHRVSADRPEFRLTEAGPE